MPGDKVSSGILKAAGPRRVGLETSLCISCLLDEGMLRDRASFSRVASAAGAAAAGAAAATGAARSNEGVDRAAASGLACLRRGEPPKLRQLELMDTAEAVATGIDATGAAVTGTTFWI